MIRYYRLKTSSGDEIYKIHHSKIYKYHKYHKICKWWFSHTFMHCTNRYVFNRKVIRDGYPPLEDITNSEEWKAERVMRELVS